jgi:hypothetical protein
MFVLLGTDPVKSLILSSQHPILLLTLLRGYPGETILVEEDKHPIRTIVLQNRNEGPHRYGRLANSAKCTARANREAWRPTVRTHMRGTHAR